MHHHGLHSSEGWVPYSGLSDLLPGVLANLVLAFVKGPEKKKWLLEITTNATVVEITEMYEQRKTCGNDNDDSDEYDVHFDDDDDEHSDTSRDTFDGEEDGDNEQDDEDDEEDNEGDEYKDEHHEENYNDITVPNLKSICRPRTLAAARFTTVAVFVCWRTRTKYRITCTVNSNRSQRKRRCRQ